MRIRVFAVSVALLIALAAFGASAEGADSASTSGRSEMKPVLLVMDVQNVWLPRMAEEDRESAPDRINDAIALFREFGHPIIGVYHSHPERGPELDSEPFQFPATIAVTDDDIRVVKAHPSAFTKTELGDVLAESGCNRVFISGLSATGCVLATYFGAMEREFMPLMVQGTLLSPDATHTRFIEEICYSVTLEELREAMEGD